MAHGHGEGTGALRSRNIPYVYCSWQHCKQTLPFVYFLKMVVTHKVNLPEYEELDVTEVNLSISSLRAGAFLLGKHCEYENDEFMLCRQENQDPRQCLAEGKNVTSCALSFFQKVKASCKDEFMQYTSCLYNSSGDMKFSFCRNTQAVFDKCMKDNYDLERPDYGYFCRIKVHKTDRPMKVEEPTVYKDAAPKLPDDAEKPPANLGSRFVVF